MRRRAVLFCLLVGPALVGPVPAQETSTGPASLGAEPNGDSVAALEADLRVERAMLDEDLERYAALSRRRGRSMERLEELYSLLDEALTSDEAGASARGGLLMDQIEAAESDRSGLLAQQRTIVERILQRARRIDLLEQQVTRLAGQREEAAGVLSGTWDVVLMPLEQRGTFNLRQFGTLVSGTYELRGGWTGSLQGTLVNRKVLLVRIDSKLGRSMEFEGTLSGDGTTIRGTWLNYELAGAEGGTGQWSATKR